MDPRSLCPDGTLRKDASASTTRDDRFLLTLVRPYRLGLLVVLGCMSAQSLLALTNPWLAGQFSAALLGERPVAGLLLVWLGVIAAQAGLGYAVAVRSQQVLYLMTGITSFPLRGSLWVSPRACSRTSVILR
jgi:hypothetical protein